MTYINIDKLEALAKQRDESAEYEYDNDRWRCRGCGRLDTRCKCDEMLAASVPALIAEIKRLRAIEAAAKTWMEWGGHCPTCAFVRHREGNPQLSLEMLWNYCDCGWHAASAALAAKENEK